MRLPRSLPARRRGGISSTEYIVGVTLTAIMLITVVTVFGHRIARRFAGAANSLDDGRPHSGMEYTPPLNIGNSGKAPVVTHPLGNVNPATSATANDNPNPSGLPAVPRVPDPTPTFGGGTLANLSGYDPRTILSNMTQIDQNPVTADDNVRCVIASYTAAAVMGGPGAVQRLIDDLTRRIAAGTTPVGPGGGTIPDAQALAALGMMRDRLEAGNFDYRDLGMLQQLIYEHYGGGPGAGTTLAQQLNLTGLGNPSDPSGNPIGAPGTANNNFTYVNRANLVSTVNGLNPGESMIVGANEFHAPGTATSDHALLMGRDASGRVYLYDPWPKTNPGGGQIPPQLIYYDQNPGAFDYYLDNYAPSGGFDIGSPVRF